MENHPISAVDFSFPPESHLPSPRQYRRKRLAKYAIRTSLAIALYFLFWKHEWVRWSLWVYAPMNLLSLIANLYLIRQYSNRLRFAGDESGEQEQLEAVRS